MNTKLGIFCNVTIYKLVSFDHSHRELPCPLLKTSKYLYQSRFINMNEHSVVHRDFVMSRSNFTTFECMFNTNLYNCLIHKHSVVEIEFVNSFHLDLLNMPFVSIFSIQVSPFCVQTSTIFTPQSVWLRLKFVLRQSTFRYIETTLPPLFVLHVWLCYLLYEFRLYLN